HKAREFRVDKSREFALDVVARAARARGEHAFPAVAGYTQHDGSDLARRMGDPTPAEEPAAAHFQAIDTVAKLGWGGCRHKTASAEYPWRAAMPLREE